MVRNCMKNNTCLLVHHRRSLWNTIGWSSLAYVSRSKCVYRVCPIRVHYGSIMGPSWVHHGSIMGPLWVHYAHCLVMHLDQHLNKNRYSDKNQCSDKNALQTRIPIQTVKKRASEANKCKGTKRIPLRCGFSKRIWWHTYKRIWWHTCKRIWGLTQVLARSMDTITFGPEGMIN